ncbi:MAG: PHP domain-containing protein [Alistipes putredinis]
MRSDAASGTAIFSLTDHNCVRGLDEAAGGASKAGLGFVPGIEVDCNFEGTDLHLLGYGIDRRSRDFASLEQDVAAKVTEAFGETVHRLRKLGFAVDGAAVLAAAGGKLPTLELVAEVMLSDAAYDTPLLAPYREGGARGDMPYINFIWITGRRGGLRSCPSISWITGMPSP